MIEHLLSRIVASQGCSVSLIAAPRDMPSCLPEEVRFFFARTLGGLLFMDPEGPTPQFGCDLGFPSQAPVSHMTGQYGTGFCEGPEFDHLYQVAELSTHGEYDFAVVSTLPDSFGQMFYFPLSLGDPALTWDFRVFLAPSFSRWLEIHIEAWEIYQEDWREGLQTFRGLIERERRKLAEK